MSSSLVTKYLNFLAFYYYTRVLQPEVARHDDTLFVYIINVGWIKAIS